MNYNTRNSFLYNVSVLEKVKLIVRKLEKLGIILSDSDSVTPKIH